MSPRAAGPVQATAGAVCGVSVTQPRCSRTASSPWGVPLAVAVDRPRRRPRPGGGAALTLTAGSRPDEGAGRGQRHLRGGRRGLRPAAGRGDPGRFSSPCMRQRGQTSRSLPSLKTTAPPAEDREPENNALSTDPLLLNNEPPDRRRASRMTSWPATPVRRSP